MKSEDITLVQRALADSNEFAAIVEKYEKKLDSYLKSIIFAAKEDREDILQDIFIAAYRFLNSYKSEYSFSTWLYRIAHNQAMSFLRKHKTRLAAEYLPQSKENDDNDVIENITSEENIEQEVEKILAVEQVKGKLSLLNTQDREVLVLRYCEQKEYNEIASILMLPEGTIASIIHRAKIKLKKLVSHDKTK
jgi:RNA polymerase sigma-70 factor (ECF subfamily)